MVIRLAIAFAVLVVAVVAARIIERRRPDAPARDRYPVPRQLDRADFPRPDAPWLVVLFSSATCDSCQPMAQKVAALESDFVATVDVEATADQAIHDRYGIEGVPLVVVADDEGVVRNAFVGPVPATELWEAVADLRTP